MMKKVLILAISLFALTLSAGAQDMTKQQLEEKGIKLKMAYDDYKKLYDPKDYVPELWDPYSPVGTGIASFFIPGLGQMINGEGGRGALMLCGHVVLWGGFIASLFWASKDYQGKYVAAPGATAIRIGCCCLDLGLDVWSIIDAVNMAKIKNMYYKDCQTLKAASSLDVKLKPSLAMVPAGQNLSPAPGLTLAVTF